MAIMKYEERLSERVKKSINAGVDIRVSLNTNDKWRMVQNHLAYMFGNDVTNPEGCLQRYFNSNEYKANSQIVKTIFDLKKITKEEILEEITKDEIFIKKRDKIVNIYRETKELNNIDEAELVKYASLLGIPPSDDGLFKFLFTRDKIDYLTFDITRLQLVCTIISRTLLDGYAVINAVNETTMSQARGRNYYRGENAYYRCSRPSIYRGIKNEERESFEKLFIRQLIKNECMHLLEQFDAVFRWGKGDANFEALGQHYGVPTEMIDFTTDLNTALFFACCKWEDNKWLPLTKKDFEKKSSRKDIYARGGDSRYGVIYICPCEIQDIEYRLHHNMQYSDTLFMPIGYQPFMRCHSQYGYMLITKNVDFDLYQNQLFNKFKFKLDEDICNFIYEKMDKGGKIYPNDDVPELVGLIDRIKNSKFFSRKAFDSLCEGFKYSEETKNIAQKRLNELGITISDDIKFISDLELNDINKKYSVDYALSKVPDIIDDPLLIL